MTPTRLVTDVATIWATTRGRNDALLTIAGAKRISVSDLQSGVRVGRTAWADHPVELSSDDHANSAASELHRQPEPLRTIRRPLLAIGTMRLSWSPLPSPPKRKSWWEPERRHVQSPACRAPRRICGRADRAHLRRLRQGRAEMACSFRRSLVRRRRPNESLAPQRTRRDRRHPRPPWGCTRRLGQQRRLVRPLSKSRRKLACHRALNSIS